MPRKYFPFYFTFREAGKTMPPRLRATFYEAIIDYATTGVEPVLPPSISGCWAVVKPLLDTSQKRYNAGVNGGRPSKNDSFGFPDSETYGLHKEKEKEKEKDNENENEREKEKEKDSKAAAAAGAPDTPPADIFTTFADGDGELLQALQDYDSMRREKRKTLTDTMRRSLCQQLDEEFHRCEWTEVVKQATRQGWLKFYPLDKDKPTSTVPEFESAGDQISRIIENLKRKNGA